MRPLLGLDLRAILHSDPVTKGRFRGCFALNETFQYNTKFPAIYIFNTGTLSSPGEHWLGIYIDSDGSCDYFCSLGTAPLAGLYDKLKKKLKVTTIKYNTISIQHPLSTTCGYFVYYFLYYRSRGLQLDTIVNTFKNYDYFLNESLIRDFVFNFLQYA